MGKRWSYSFGHLVLPIVRPTRIFLGATALGRRRGSKDLARIFGQSVNFHRVLALDLIVESPGWNVGPMLRLLRQAVFLSNLFLCIALCPGRFTHFVCAVA